LPDVELVDDVFEELVPLVPLLEPEVPDVLGEVTFANVLAKLGDELLAVEVVGDVELLASISNEGICGSGWAIGEIELILLYPSVESVAAR
jgi:hypothetical protein